MKTAPENYYWLMFEEGQSEEVPDKTAKVSSWEGDSHFDVDRVIENDLNILKKIQK